MRHIVASSDDLLHTVWGDIFTLGELEDLLLPGQEQQMLINHLKVWVNDGLPVNDFKGSVKLPLPNVPRVKPTLSVHH